MASEPLRAQGRTEDGCCFVARLYAPRISSRSSLVPDVTEELECLVTERPLDWDARSTFELFPKLSRVASDCMDLAVRVLECFGCSLSPMHVQDVRRWMTKCGAGGQSLWLRSKCHSRVQNPRGLQNTDEQRASLRRLPKGRARVVMDGADPTTLVSRALIASHCWLPSTFFFTGNSCAAEANCAASWKASSTGQTVRDGKFRTRSPAWNSPLELRATKGDRYDIKSWTRYTLRKNWIGRT